MAQRILNVTDWVVWTLVLIAGPFGQPAAALMVRKNPSIIEEQAKFFQDFFSVQLSPYKVEFGHVCEDPNNWEQRYERKDYKNHRDMGKVRWGDKKGGYGEHYWDLNHAGHADNHRDGDDYDDGSYHEEKYNDPYEEPSETHPNYTEDDYEPETTPSYDFNDKSKRLTKNKNGKINKQIVRQDKNVADLQKSSKELTDVVQKEDHNKPPSFKPVQKTINDNIRFIPANLQVTTTNAPVDHHHHYHQQPVQWKPHLQFGFDPSAAWPGPHVHFGQRAPLRQLQPPVVPRLYFDAASGRVVDKATGESFMLQPMVVRN